MTHVAMRIRRASESDIEAISRVGHATWPSTYGFAGQEYVERGLAQWYSEDAIRQSLRDTEMWVAEVDGAVVGIGNVDLHRDPPTIWKLYVIPAHHGSGVGSALLEQLVASVPAERGVVALEYVDGNERAGEFYARQGFVETSREPGEQPGWPEVVWVERTLSG
jgi:ribosomal protein S18 acetylase RimI-like enzyme